MPFLQVRILLVGLPNSGKTTIANYLGDICTKELEESHRPTKGLRIVEFDANNIEVDERYIDVDVQLWDTNCSDECVSLWPLFRKYTDGVVFVYAQDDEVGVRKLDSMYNYFVTQRNLNPCACLVCIMPGEQNSTTRLSSMFSKLTQVTVNLDQEGEKFKQDFAEYLRSVIKTITPK